MTAPQTQLYFRAWQAAAKVHGWTTKTAILAALQSHHAGHVWESQALTQVLTKIYELALITSAAADRDPTADDLRHACTAVALGRQASSKKFTNAEFDRVLALLRLLAGPDLNSVAAFDDVEAGARRRYLHVITSAPAAYWQRIASDKFQTTDLDRLTLDQLRQLSMTIRARLARHVANSHSQPLAAAAA